MLFLSGISVFSLQDQQCQDMAPKNSGSLSLERKHLNFV